MAYYRFGRDDDHHYPPWETPTDDEDDGPEETSSSSFVSKQPQETLITYPPKGPAISTDTTPTVHYPPKMTEKPSDGKPGLFSRTDYSWGASKPWDSDYTDRGPPSHTTFSTALVGNNNGLVSSAASATPTRSFDDVSSPAPTNDDPTEIQNNEAENAPNRTPMYAAAGITPVVVIIVGFVLFFFLRKRRQQKRQTDAQLEHHEEMKMRPKSVAMPYLAPITPPSPPPTAALPQYSPSTPSSSQPPTASSSQPVILGPIPSGSNGAYLTGMDTSDLVSMTSAGGVSRQGTVVDRDPFADGRSLEEAPPPYRPSSLPPVSVASTSRNSSVRIAAAGRTTSRTQLVERSPFDDPEDDEVSELSGPTLGRGTEAMSDVSELSYQIDPVIGRSPF
ncbi:hypothetical protein SVAN01_05984 [Stagonosporopsis vannaccii]|nr:hypothetical protein SVAN01_05984 [Stagonosporopsis vannaccii]